MYSGVIYLSWYLTFHAFQYLNYKSLESVLVTYPEASVRFKLLAPRAHLHDRFGEILPRPIFSKYSKQGFNLVTVVQERDDEFYRTTPAFQYWTRTYYQSFLHNISSTFNKIPISSFSMDVFPAPYHLVLYDILVRLQRTGGMYSDLSWMHLQPLEVLNLVQAGKTTGGFQMRISCNAVPMPPSPNVNRSRPVSYCKPSLVLVFSAGHSVLGCMLEYYATEKFQRCLDEDRISQGAFCIEKSLNACFRDARQTNALYPDLVSSNHSIDTAFCYEDFSQRESSRQELSKIARKHVPKDCRPLSRSHVDLLLDSTDNSRSSQPYTISPTQHLLWLNLASFYTEWLVPNNDSIVDRIVQQNNRKLLAFYSQHAHDTLDLTNFTSAPCSPYATQPTDYIGNRQRANMSCALTFVLPGFMKSGSTYIYDTIDNHPWVVNALRGFDYKEAGCYLPETVGNVTRRFLRMSCYPFIEAHDRVVYGDGAIVYAPRKDIAQHLLVDNPNIKVVFAVRDPLERALSIHRYDYYNLQKLGHGNINECLHQAFSLRPFLLWHSLAVNATSSSNTPTERAHYRARLSERFMNDIVRLFATQGAKLRCLRVIYDSLYFPQIYYWAQRIPAHNLRVLNVQKLQATKMSKSEKMVALQTVPVIEQYDLRDLFQSAERDTTVYNSSQDSSRVVASRDERLNKRPGTASRHSRLNMMMGAKENRRRRLQPSTSDELDDAYLKYQFNALYR